MAAFKLLGEQAQCASVFFKQDLLVMVTQDEIDR